MMNVGLVGCGWVAEKHISFIRSMPSCQIVGITDQDQLARTRMAAKQGLDSDKTFETLSQLLRETQTDVVHILTPPFSHKELALEAIRHGKHVYIEKPLALNFSEVKDILGDAAKRGVKVCPGYNYLFDPIVSEAIGIVESPEFGRTVYVESYYGMNMRRYDRLKTSRENEIHWSYHLPGGFHQNYITHPLYMCLRFTGKVKKLHVTCKSMGAIPQELTDEIRVLIEGEQAMGMVVQSYSCEPYQHFMVIYGEKQAVKIDWRNITLLNYRKHRLPDAINRVLINNLDLGWQHGWSSLYNMAAFATKRAVPYHGIKLLIEQFYRSIEGSLKPPVAEDLVLNTELTSDKIYAEIPKKHLDLSTRQPRPIQLSGKGRVLVTGASGFVGKEVVRRFIKEGYQVSAFVRKLSYIKELEDMGVEILFGDIRHYPSFLEAAQGKDVIIHLAAALGVPATEYIDITVGGVENLIRIVGETGVKKVIYMSSMSVYDVIDCRADVQVSEDHIYERRPSERGAYAASKLEAEKLVRNELSATQKGWTILRPSMIIGRSTKVFLNPIGIVLGRLRVVFGLGFDHLRLIPVEDVTDAILMCVESHDVNGKIYNINHDDLISKRQYLKHVVKPAIGKGLNIYIPHVIMFAMIYLAEKLFRIIGRKPPLTRYRYRTAQKKVYFDSSRIRRELGWKPRISLHEYFRINYIGNREEEEAQNAKYVS